MKQTISKLLVVLSLFTFSLNSHAIVIVDTIASTMAYNANDYDRYQSIEEITEEVGWAFLCILVIPVCLLEEEQKESVGFTIEGLTERGYENAASLISEHGTCMEKLKASGKMLSVEDNETPESIAAGMKKACNASPALIELYQSELL